MLLITPIENVKWIETEVVTTRNLEKLNQFLSPFRRQYTFIPDFKPRGASISVLQFKDKGPDKTDKKRIIGSENLRPFKASGDIDPRGTIRIRSSPFVAVNPALFMSYASEGTISFTARDRSAMLCDIKYLEGMNGAIAFDHLDGNSLGIVIGSLKKSNGEGEFTLIAPWAEIVRSMEKTIANVRHLRSITPSKSMGELAISLPSEFSGVVALLVSKPGNSTIWGSGVLIDPETVVTNSHVVENHIAITAWFQKNEKIEATVQSIPIKNVDVAFLKLKHATKYNPVKLSQRVPEPHDRVESVGYGMIYPHSMTELQPLVSLGVISRVVKMSLSSRSPSMPVLMITSAGCWNGSSGGALFDSNTTELLGIMTSNGRMDDTGEIIPTMSFILPVQMIKYAWEIAKSDRNSPQAILDSRIINLWRLQETHKTKL